ncbi:MAG: SDR family NAD(P)-dependent oxidoreductase [Oscillospiraceae bacterium]
MRLKDNVAIVIGGVSGIGLAIAERFVKEGATVVVADINESRLKETEEALKAQGNRGYAAKCDMTDSKQLQALANGAKEKFGRVDILVCSGGASWNVPFIQMTDEEWTKMVHMHLDSAFYASKAVAPMMIEQHYGRLIFISSGHGVRGRAGKVHYSAAKGGVVAFARALGSELGPYGITANTLAPGLTVTPMVESQMGPEALAAAANSMPTKRLGRPEDLAAAAVLLASEEGGHINCHTLAIDGGDSVADAARNA